MIDPFLPTYKTAENIIQDILNPEYQSLHAIVGVQQTRNQTDGTDTFKITFYSHPAAQLWLKQILTDRPKHSPYQFNAVELSFATVTFTTHKSTKPQPQELPA